MAIDERQLVPYQAEPLRGERLLVLAPHPDDEIIGCGGLVALHASEGRGIETIIATDGSAAQPDGTSPDDYSALRENESIAGLAVVNAPAPTFLRFLDRTLESSIAELSAALGGIIEKFRPDLILLPSPVEIHPDHRALCRAFIDLIHAREEISRDLPLCRVAFYEVSQPIRPNLLVDITAVADLKFKALAEHRSQMSLHDYHHYATGLNQYRTMTLGDDCRFAEGYWVVELPTLRTVPWSSLCQNIAGAQGIESVDEILPVTVIIRTKDRIGLLREAVQSVAATDYPSRIVVVNDGGESPRDALDAWSGQIELIDQRESLGRSEAMNAGVRAASTRFVAFLDDDDLFYPEHLPTLARAIGSGAHKAVYSDAVSVSITVDDDGRPVETERRRIFAQDYDRDLLILDNYIPLPTLLTRREDFLDAGGFDPVFDLFEDWEFLLRLSRNGSFLRVPRVTCEIRHFAGSSSVVLASPGGSASFNAAKLAVWKRHEADFTPETIARAIEKTKNVAQQRLHSLAVSQGRAHHLERDTVRLARETARLEKDKQTLIGEISSLHQRSNEVAARVEELERILNETRAALAESGSALSETRSALTERGIALDSARATLIERDRQIQELTSALSIARSGSTQQGEALRATYAEIERLNEMLGQIYRSKTWKLHTMLERLRGRG